MALARTDRDFGIRAAPHGRGTAIPHALRGLRAALPALVLALLVAAPILAVFGFLLQPSDGIWAHLASTVLGEYVRTTLLLAVGVAALTTLMGSGCAWLVTMYRFPGRDLFNWALILPLAMPAYVLAYAYTDVLQVTGPIQTWLREVTGWSVRDYWFPNVRSVGGAVFVLGCVLYPYVYVMARAAFLEQSQCALEVSRTLGCSAFAAFRRVGLPLARPAIATGVAFVLMETLADFGTVSYFALHTFTTGIYRAWYALGSPAAAAQLASVLLIAVFAVLAVERLARGRSRFANNTTHIFRKPAHELRGGKAWLASLACALPVLLGFALPALILVVMAFESGEATRLERLVALTGNTVLLGVLASLVIVAVAVLAIYAASRDRGGLASSLVRGATLGYAAPGAVIGVGILIALGAFDRIVDEGARALLGTGTGLVLGGTVMALIYGYLVRFFAVAYNPLDAGLAKITPSLEDAARVLGAGRTGVLRRIHLPLLRASLLSALLLVFVEVMKELPATLILRPFNFDTLAVEAYRMATTERLEGAALPSLVIVAAGLVPVVLLCRMLVRGRSGRDVTC